MTMTSIIMGEQTTSPSSTNTVYSEVTACSDGSWNVTEANRQQIIPEACTLSVLKIKIRNAPGVGKSHAFTVVKNTVATSLTVTISDNNRYAEDLIHSVSFAAGDSISLQSVPTGTPTGVADVGWTIQASATDQILLGVNNNNLSNSATQYDVPWGGMGHARSTTESDMSVICAANGTIKNLYAALSGTPGALKNYNVTLMKNGVATALSVTISDLATTGNDTVNSVSVSAGDTLSLRFTPSVVAPTVRMMKWGLAFAPTTAGELIYGFASNISPSNTTVQYNQPLSYGQATWGGETGRTHMFPAATVKAFYAKLSAAPGAGKSYEIRLRRNSSANTPASVTISDAATSGSISLTGARVSLNDLVSMRSTPTGTPATVFVKTGLVITLDTVSSNARRLSLLGVGA